MERLTFSIDINAPKGKVWSTLFDDETYRQWTEPFMPGSYAVTDWKEGSKAMFLTPEKDGMSSVIETNKPNELLVIKHLGTVKKGVEDFDSEENKAWAGATESYTLNENDGITTLTAGMDTIEKYKDYFEKTYPKALQKVKELAEGNGSMTQ